MGIFDIKIEQVKIHEFNYSEVMIFHFVWIESQKFYNQNEFLYALCIGGQPRGAFRN